MITLEIKYFIGLHRLNMEIIVSRVSNLNLEIFNRRWRIPSFLQGDSEIHADVCRVQGFLKRYSIPQMQFRFSYLIINTETLVPLNSENLIVRFGSVL